MKRIIISRTDNIGDVVLTLPMAGVIKELYPQSQIIFLGKKYTQAVIALSKYVDEFADWSEFEKLDEEERVKKFKALNADCIIHVFPNIDIASLAKKAGIETRIGTSRKFYHLLNCNQLINLRRKNTDLHEAQLNLRLLQFLGAKKNFDLNEIKKYYGFETRLTVDHPFAGLLDMDKFNLIIHPKSKGSAREWGAENIIKLAASLPKDRFKIFITGGPDEVEVIHKEITERTSDVIDLAGKMTLPELISFIALSDGLLAASTGPLHIAAALGKYTLGIYAPMRPIFPTRWAPLGDNAHFLVLNKNCADCKRGGRCACIEQIDVQAVKQELLQFAETKKEKAAAL